MGETCSVCHQPVLVDGADIVTMGDGSYRHRACAGDFVGPRSPKVQEFVDQVIRNADAFGLGALVPPSERAWYEAARPTVTIHSLPVPVHPPPPPGWRVGTPKRCPGSGVVPRARYMGDLDGYGERMYRVRCDHCGRPEDPGATGMHAAPEHTFIPVNPDEEKP